MVGTLLGLAGLAAVAKRALTKAVERIMCELKTGNGATLAEYIVKVDAKVDVMAAKQDEIAGMSRDNRTLIEDQGRQLRETRDRITLHTVEGH